MNTGAMKRAIGSFHAIATFLGVTSPKIRIKRVSVPVTTPRKSSPHVCMVKLVTKAERLIFTRLLQIRTVAMKMLGLLYSSLRSFPLLPPFSARLSTWKDERDVKAVSLPEKKPERSKRTIIIIMSTMLDIRYQRKNSLAILLLNSRKRR